MFFDKWAGGPGSAWASQASISGRLEEFFHKLEVEPKAPDPKSWKLSSLVKKPLVLN